MNGMADSPDKIEAAQRTLCLEKDALFLSAPEDSKLGFAFSTEGRRPINGLRHLAEGGTNGWYIWFGESLSTEPNFFSPIHAFHLYEKYPELVRLLGLAPGYRFLLDGDYLDVWFDATLLEN